MTTLSDLTAFAPGTTADSHPADQAQPSLRELPKLLEYRSEADPDAEFIPKTIGGFIFGAMVFGFCINFGDAVYKHHMGIEHAKLVSMMLTRGAFMMGITGVASSLMLVGLKVRADHSPVDLFAKHWLNSITTGSLYALMIWAPWIIIDHQWGLNVNRFIAAAILMAIMAFPAIAAKWTIGAHLQRQR